MSLAHEYSNKSCNYMMNIEKRNMSLTTTDRFPCDRVTNAKYLSLNAFLFKKDHFVISQNGNKLQLLAPPPGHG